MSDRFEHVYFQDCDLNDCFFDSLKTDYVEFEDWFTRKSNEKEKVYIYKDINGICAFMYLKEEDEELGLQDEILHKEKRIKIGTLKLDERIKGKRLGEGALGLALWKWQETAYNQIYVTVFEHHATLIGLLENFGFAFRGKNTRGECVYIKDRRTLSYDDPYKAFPFLIPNFNKGGYIPIDDYYHDTLFPYSQLANVHQHTNEISAANGISKTYIGFPSSSLHIQPNEPVFIYRKYTEGPGKGFRSVISSYCTVHRIIQVKSNHYRYMDEDEFVKIAHNKTVFEEVELRKMYHEKRTIVMIDIVYNGYFGAGNNVNFNWLKDNGCFNAYPYNVQLDKSQVIKILQKGGKDVQNVIIN